MKRLVIRLLLNLAWLCIKLFVKISDSEISNITYLHQTERLDVEIWDKNNIFNWKEYKNCNYADRMARARITYWDIEEDFNTMKGVNYNE